MNKPTSIGALFEALTANMSTAEIKTAMVISDISAKIEIERINKGMTQMQFAKFMGVSQGMVSKWESGEYNFTIEAIANIFDKLGLDFDFTITPDIELISVNKSNETINFNGVIEVDKTFDEILFAG